MVQAFTATTFPSGMPLATYVLDEDDQPTVDPRGSYRITLADGISIDEIGPVRYGPQYDVDGETVIGWDKDVSGYHVNFRAFGDTAYLLSHGIDQSGPEGEYLDVWTRTRILTLIPELQPVYLTEIGEPTTIGYVGLAGLRLYDPSIVTRQARVWL